MKEQIEHHENQYLTISAPVRSECTIRRSRFICLLSSILDVDRFRSSIDDAMIELPNATHYCWAYRYLSGDKVEEHYSDAGEPSGSAGRPIWGELKRADLLNVGAIVVRYFGGVKLGIPGLIEAYSSTARAAVELADIIVDEPRAELIFISPYDIYNTFTAKLKPFGINILDKDMNFSEKISGTISIPLRYSDEISRALESMIATKGLSITIKKS